MRVRLIMAIIAGVFGAITSHADDPAQEASVGYGSRAAGVDEGDVALAEVEGRRIDLDAAATYLPGLFDADEPARMSVWDDGEAGDAELASALTAYAGCEVVAEAILDGLNQISSSVVNGRNDPRPTR